MNRFRNFTLIELLVVITIITILAAMLLPSLNQARTRAKSTACLSQHKQFGTALAMYAADFQDDIPTLADNPVKLKNSDSTPPAGLGLLAAHLGYSLGRDSKSAEDKGKLKIFKCPGGDREFLRKNDSLGSRLHLLARRDGKRPRIRCRAHCAFYREVWEDRRQAPGDVSLPG